MGAKTKQTQRRSFGRRCGLISLAVAVSVLAVLHGLFWEHLREILLMGGGFVALRSCSHWHLQARHFNDLLDQEISSVAKLASVSYNPEDGSVEAWILLPWLTRKAAYRPAFGCTLLDFSGRVPLAPVPEVMVPLTKQLDEPWPMGELLDQDKVRAVQTVVDMTAIERHAELLMNDRPYNLRGLLVLYKGQIIWERYAEGFHAQMPMMSWSGGKSWVATLLGMRAMDGELSMDEPLAEPLWTQIPDDPRMKLTVEDGLRMRTGLRWQEVYDPFPPKDPTRMLFNQGSAADYAADAPLAEPTGTFYYSSGTTNLLSAKLRRSFASQEDYLRYPRERLFSRLGMHSSVMELDAAGTFVGSSLNYASTRDWARWGLLHVQDGVWEGQRLLPEGWVRFISDGSRVNGTGSNGHGYGGQVWLRRPQCTPAELEGPPPAPASETEARAAWLLGLPGFRKCSRVQLPEDLFFANGFEGQTIFVAPAEELVVVRMGCTHFKQELNAAQDFEEFLATVVEATRLRAAA